MDVTDVLRDRMQEPPGLQRMATISVLVHAAAIAAVIVAPGALMPSQDRTARSVMTITLGSGAPGPQSGGLTSMGGRAVQAEAPPDMKRVPVTPPAAKTPEMTVPLPGKTQAKATPAPPVKQAPDTARGRTPSRGAETTAGSTSVETNVRGQGFGLSTSGGVGTGVQLDVTDFCCPDYLNLMSQRIHQHWNSTAETPSQVTVTFTIQRDGTLTNPILKKSSGNSLLDMRAQTAIVSTRSLLPLPREFPNPTLTVHLTFQYVR
jgi:TonB family protein